MNGIKKGFVKLVTNSQKKYRLIYVFKIISLCLLFFYLIWNLISYDDRYLTHLFYCKIHIDIHITHIKFKAITLLNFFGLRYILRNIL